MKRNVDVGALLVILMGASAIIGMAAIPFTSNGDGKINLAEGLNIGLTVGAIMFWGAIGIWHGVRRDRRHKQAES